MGRSFVTEALYLYNELFTFFLTLKMWLYNFQTSKFYSLIWLLDFGAKNLIFENAVITPILTNLNFFVGGGITSEYNSTKTDL